MYRLCNTRRLAEIAAILLVMVLREYTAISIMRRIETGCFNTRSIDFGNPCQRGVAIQKSKRASEGANFEPPNITGMESGIRIHQKSSKRFFLKRLSSANQGSRARDMSPATKIISLYSFGAVA